MKVYLAALGCKLNESEIESWSRQLTTSGWEVVNDPALAELCILNTCTVTSQAARKSRTAARQLARLNPNARLALTGCYATLSPAQAASLPQVVKVIPNSKKESLVAESLRLWQDREHEHLRTGCRLPEAASGLLGRPSLRESPRLRTRAFVKVQDGCNMSCTYCVIPMARGQERSRPHGEVVAEVEQLARDGYQEVILTGVQISDYAYAGDKRHGLARLVRQILAETQIPRLRLTSIAPWDLDAELLGLFADHRLCRHLHLSLQSGSDTVLRRMRRPYTSGQFAAAVVRARAAVSGLALTTDVIVGFPGETETEFSESLDFVGSMGFARIHVFSYSPRAGTAAAAWPQVPEAVKAQRAQRMQALADQCMGDFALLFRGQVLPVLWEAAEESPPGGPRWTGYSDNYIRFATHSHLNLANTLTPTLLLNWEGEVASGQVSV